MNAQTTFWLETRAGVTFPALFLRLEAIGIAALSIIAFGAVGGDWSTQFLWLLVPDLAMVGYLWGARVGGFSYNLTHNYALPIILGLVGAYLGQLALLHIALLWSAHVGIDRLLGFGLKYKTGFTHTHLHLI